MPEMNHAEVANILETVYGRKKGEDIPIVQASLKAAADERKIASGEYATENKPLTLDELRQMVGEPVWIVESPDWGHWEFSDDAEDYLIDRDPDFYGMMHDDPAGRYGLHVLGWLAYARKPEQEDDNA